MSRIELLLPLTRRDREAMKIGEWLHLSGCLYTARDAALKRICGLIQDDKTPPFELKDQLIYFVGPTPAAAGEPIGAAGPTTSRRMEPFLPYLLEAGISGVIGKGPLSEAMALEFQRQGAVYLAAAGGAGAFYGSKVRGAATVAYEELGPEAVYSLKVEHFPVVVAIDLAGRNLFAEGPQAYRKEAE